MVTNELFSEAEVELLTSERVARIATTNPIDNQPHVVPVCFAFDGKTIITTLNSKSKRLKHIEQGSKTAILVDKYEENQAQTEWKTLQGLLIQGNTRILTFQDNKQEFMNCWKLLIQKYPQYKQWANTDYTPKDPDKRRLMKIVPTRTTRWGFE